MIKTCNEEYWRHMAAAVRPDNGPCGRTYDDIDHSTICPHNRLLSREERSELLTKILSDDTSGFRRLNPDTGQYEPIGGQ